MKERIADLPMDDQLALGAVIDLMQPQILVVEDPEHSQSNSAA